MDSHTTSELLGFLGTFFGLAAAVSILLKLQDRTAAVKIAAVLICAGLLWIPVGGLYLFEYFISLAGHLSITTIMLLSASLSETLLQRRLIDTRERLLICLAIIAAGIILYPSAYGMLSFSTYQFGFGSLSFAIALMLLAILFTVFRKHLALSLIILSVLAFDLNLFSTGNLWDYLIDPLVVIYAVVTVTIWVFRTIRTPRGSPQ